MDNRRKTARKYQFLSPPSARRATVTVPAPESFKDEFLSPPSARRATVHRRRRGHGRRISIPALREEGDGDLADAFPQIMEFLSPPSARRATVALPVSKLARIFLSPPSARRATANDSASVNVAEISIPALREEGDGNKFTPSKC